jgi:hypothetical protein
MGGGEWAWWAKRVGRLASQRASGPCGERGRAGEVVVWAGRQAKAQGEGEVACGWAWEKQAAQERRRGKRAGRRPRPWQLG